MYPYYTRITKPVYWICLFILLGGGCSLARSVIDSTYEGIHVLHRNHNTGTMYMKWVTSVYLQRLLHKNHKTNFCRIYLSSSLYKKASKSQNQFVSDISNQQPLHINTRTTKPLCIWSLHTAQFTQKHKNHRVVWKTSTGKTNGHVPPWPDLDPKWIRLTQMGQVLDFFRSLFSTIRLGFERYQICPIWGQSDPHWTQIWHPCRNPWYYCSCHYGW